MAKSKSFVRESRVTCGKSGNQVAEFFQYTDEGQAATAKKRKPKEHITPEKIRRMNEKRAKKYFYALLTTNFGKNDIHLTLTYQKIDVTDPEKDLNRQAKLYLDRVRRRRKQLGLEPLKYVLVTEYGVSRKTGEVVRLHHHIVMNGGIDRDDLELMWTKKRIDWRRLEKEAQEGKREYRDALESARIGFANADRLKPGEDGLGALAQYLMKSPAGKRRWVASRNLEKPTRTKNDSKYSRRKLVNACTSGEVYSRQWWERHYPGYTLAGSPDLAVEAVAPDDQNNWQIYARIRKRGGESS